MQQKEQAAREQEAAARAAATAKVQAAMGTSAGGLSAAAAQADIIAPLENNRKLRKNIFAPLPSVTRGKPTLIGGDPKNKDNILYCVGNDVIIRSLHNPLISDIYIEHPRPTTVARYSPCGRYVASADSTGLVRVWHTEVVQGVYFKLKSEKPVIAGPILDMAWSHDSTKIVAVGQGREKMGEVFDMESGSSRGIITGHSKAITTVDYRQQSPYRIITGSEDLTLNWFEGPPFKWVHGMNDHNRFVNCTRFSPDGAHALSVGSDKLAILYDGITGAKKSTFTTEHAGSIYCASWSPDSRQVLTSSGDKTCKIWDVETGRAVTTFTFGNAVEDQQVGCLWQGDFLVSLSLRGHFTYLDPHSPSRHAKVIQGHNKSIESVAYHAASNTLYTGSYDSVIVRWNESTGDMQEVAGDGHKNSVIAMHLQGNDLWTVSLDDTVRVTPHGQDYSGAPIALSGKPFDLAVAPNESGLAATGTFDQKVHIIRHGRVVSSKSVSYTPQALAISPDGRQVAVGGDNNNIYLYPLSGDNLGSETVLTGHRGALTSLAYSPNGRFLASADKNRDIIVWENNTIKIKDWVYHSAKVNAIAWSPNSLHIASGSLDTNVIIWSVEEPNKRVTIQAAHHGGVNDVIWLDNTTVASVGQDCTTRTWNITW
jgi:WD40 repeat protein